MTWLAFGALFVALSLVATGIAISDDRDPSLPLPDLRFERGAVLEPGPRSLATERYDSGPISPNAKALLDRVPHLNAVDPSTILRDDIVVLILSPQALDLYPTDFFVRQLQDGRAIIGINVPLKTLIAQTGFVFPSLADAPGSQVFMYGYDEPYYTLVHTCSNGRGIAQKPFSARLFEADLGRLLDCR